MWLASVCMTQNDCFINMTKSRLMGSLPLHFRWHEGGRAASKANSVADLEACLDHLIHSGVAQPLSTLCHNVKCT